MCCLLIWVFCVYVVKVVIVLGYVLFVFVLVFSCFCVVKFMFCFD